ncbi:MAG: hypothetical protein CMC40_02030 [Flavobacteriaceae bacterium]|nr:hypothetical protein [Flavobacteriaceae bacterium]
MYDMVITSLPGMDRDKPAPGPAFLKGYLETKGFKIKVIDGNQLDTLDNIHKEISQYKFKWLGISVFSYLQKDDALKLGEKYDNVLFGGSGVDVFWPRKHFVVGEGEYALVEFLNGNLDYPGINGKPPQQIENIEDLPPPDYSDVMCKHDYDTAIISGSRGCVRKCTFCDVMTIWPKYRWKTGKKIADEMHEVAEKTGLKKIGFSDSLVNGSMKHFRDMCKELASRDKKVQWNGQFIVRGAKTFSSEDFDNLANSGCNGLTMGIESGSEKVRDHMRKKFSNEDIDYFMKNLGDRKIKMKMLLIVGYPTETEEDFEETLQLLRRYKKYAKYISVSPHMMLTYKNTPLDFDHRDLYDTEGFHWKNDISNYDIRLVRFKKVFEVGQQMGYKFNKHALDKIEKFDKLQYQS